MEAVILAIIPPLLKAIADAVAAYQNGNHQDVMGQLQAALADGQTAIAKLQALSAGDADFQAQLQAAAAKRQG